MEPLAAQDGTPGMQSRPEGHTNMPHAYRQMYRLTQIHRDAHGTCACSDMHVTHRAAAHALRTHTHRHHTHHIHMQPWLPFRYKLQSLHLLAFAYKSLPIHEP